MVRLNGERAAKKSLDLKEGDQLDLIRGFNINNREQLDIDRVDILKVDDKANHGRYNFSYRKINNLTVPNYERDPYEVA